MKRSDLVGPYSRYISALNAKRANRTQLTMDEVLSTMEEVYQSIVTVWIGLGDERHCDPPIRITAHMILIQLKEEGHTLLEGEGLYDWMIRLSWTKQVPASRKRKTVITSAMIKQVGLVILRPSRRGSRCRLNDDESSSVRLWMSNYDQVRDHIKGKLTEYKIRDAIRDLDIHIPLAFIEGMLWNTKSPALLTFKDSGISISASKTPIARSTPNRRSGIITVVLGGEKVTAQNYAFDRPPHPLGDQEPGKGYNIDKIDTHIIQFKKMADGSIEMGLQSEPIPFMRMAVKRSGIDLDKAMSDFSMNLGESETVPFGSEI